MSWRERAACRGKPLALFFPREPGGRGGVEYGADARAVCRTCPVIDDCRREHWREPFGIFAGATPEQRGRNRSRSPISLKGRVA
jgi:WhiB family redox-sensing transcriptional regulator